VWAFMTLAHTLLFNATSALQLKEAFTTGARALEIAKRLGDLRLQILATTYLVQAHSFQGDHERVVELATENVAALPADWVYDGVGTPMPISIYDRGYLVRGLVELGRLTEAAAYAAEALRLAEPTQQVWPIGWAHHHIGIAL